jgi:DNA-binding MarR family transcriptional regulator
MQSDTCSSTADLAVDRQLCFLLHRNTARFIGRWDRFLRSYNLTFTEYLVLLAVWERWPVSENALAVRLQFDPFTMEEALANLERGRLVTRSEDLGIPEHRVVEATRKGLDMRPEIEEIRGRFSCELGLTPKDSAVLMAQLEKLSEALAGMDLVRGDWAAQPA